MTDPADAFAALMGRDDEEIALDRAALLIAAAEYPGLDVEENLRALDQFADQLRPRLAGLRAPADVVGTFADVVHGELGFHGNPDAYYDPRNSYLNEVLTRRLGIPISLSAVYLALGQRLGLPFEGVGLPGHFLVRYDDPLRPLLIDPFADGAILSDADCEHRLRGLYGPRVRLSPAMLDRVETRAILFRMLTNLKGIYVQAEDWPRVIRTIDHLLLVRAGASGEYRDRGNAHLRTGDLRRARADFEHYLLYALDVNDEASVREQLALIGRLEAMRN
jgi:regulator of sirC expression with transglutaminase-like and TPR domain